MNEPLHHERRLVPTFRSAESSEAQALAEMVYLCGPNLLGAAFGPGRDEALRCLTLLVSSPMTMFSSEFARVATVGESSEPAGLVIGLPTGLYRECEQRLAALTFKHKGWWRWLRLLPLSLELSRCAVSLCPDSYYISALCVRKPWQRQGLGTQLLELSAERACQIGAKRVVLDVEVGNAPALKLYEHMGYSAVSECSGGRRMRQHGILGLRRMQKVI